MGLVECLALGYLVLLLVAGLLTASLCRIAKLSARHGLNARREVLLWGSTPLLGHTALRERIGLDLGAAPVKPSHPYRFPKPGFVTARGPSAPGPTPGAKNAQAG